MLLWNLWFPWSDFSLLFFIISRTLSGTWPAHESFCLSFLDLGLSSCGLRFSSSSHGSDWSICSSQSFWCRKIFFSFSCLAGFPDRSPSKSRYSSNAWILNTSLSYVFLWFSFCNSAQKPFWARTMAEYFSAEWSEYLQFYIFRNTANMNWLGVVFVENGHPFFLHVAQVLDHFAMAFYLLLRVHRLL